MADKAIEIVDVTFRHKIPRPRFLKPWHSVNGPGIFGLNFALEKGAIIGLVGPNGAGKTTLLRVLAGINKIDQGTVLLDGTDLSESSESLEHELRSNVGHMPEQVRWSGRATVRQTIEQFAEMRSKTIDTHKLLKLVGLLSKSDSTLDELSQGMRQRLSLAIALMGNPKILLLDEPFNGLDPVAAKSVEKMIKQLASRGVAIIISSHQVDGLVGLIDSLLLIHRGQIIADGSIDQIETILGLDNRIELSGLGDIPPFETILENGVVIEQTIEATDWRCVIQHPDVNLIENLIARGHKITEWRRKSPDIVELLCCATGLEIEEIGMDIQPTTMVPLRNTGEEE